MSKRFIVLDTETTGLEVEQGHRIIEIGALLLEDRKKTDNHFHVYLNPERLVDEEAQKVHGISNKDLEDKPKFSEIADEFLEFIQNSTLIIHNAPFDLGFLNNELNLISSSYPRLEEICEVEDSLLIAREKYPGQRNSLDALTKRFDINNYDRTYHGAMLDTNILADVYFHLTGGQSKFEFSNNLSPEFDEGGTTDEISKKDIEIPSFKANSSDEAENKKRLDEIESQNNITSLWNQL
tara:strand:+ start:794 stop:1507 length:714 start_codon:yes stop_codon:yes gene_type:complete